jgi:hypothetical protein
MLIADHVEKRDQDMKSRPQGAAVLAEPLDDIGALLRYHHSGFGDDYDNHESQNDDYYDSTHGCLHFSFAPPERRSSIPRPVRLYTALRAQEIVR